MPMSIQRVSTRVVDTFEPSVTLVAVGRNTTPPRVGTHLRRTKRIHGRTQVRVLRGFSDGLDPCRLRTVNDLRAHLASHLLIEGRSIHPSEILVFGPDNKTLHGRRHIA
jgi:hypothetical protein